MRADRLLSILLLLQARGRMTAPELAEELGVSLRTVYRDVDALAVAGVPVYAERGPAGGYRLLDGYRTRLTGLTREEAESLLLAGLHGPAAELGLGAVLATAELKLLAALPAELRERAELVRGRFHLDAPGWFQEVEPAPHLAALAGAVWQQRLVRLCYRRAGRLGKEVERTLQPLGLVLKAGAWYLVGRAGEQPRTYRVSRVLELCVLEERFVRPADFDLAAFWQEWSRRYERSVYRGEAVVRLSPRGLALAPYVLAPAVARAAEATAEPPDADGLRRAVLPIESIEHAHGDLLRLGAEVEVLEPPELRERMAQTVRALGELYGG
jgi:predicted DNA-binding transcriptional regulator YafY